MTLRTSVQFLIGVFILSVTRRAFTQRNETDRRLLEARCFSRCLVYDPTASTGKQEWAPYSFTDFIYCVEPCYHLHTNDVNTCLRVCQSAPGFTPTQIALCNESCHFVDRMKMEPTGTSFSPGSPYLPDIPSSLPVVVIKDGDVTLQWKPPDPVYPSSGIDHGLGRGAVFVVQYASVQCGDTTDSLNWISGKFPELSLAEDQLYVFRVATVNANGTQGFSMPSLAYSIAKKCVKESSEIPGSPNNVRLLGFEDSSSREKVQVEVSWMKPVMTVEPLCYRVCVREEANKSANAVACHNRTLLQSIVSFKCKNGTVHACQIVVGLHSCTYEAAVSSIPMLLSTNNTVSNRVVRSAEFFNATEKIEDSSRFLSGRPLLSQEKTFNHGINVTVRWSLPVDFSPTLVRFDLTYGFGMHSANIFHPQFRKLGEQFITLSYDHGLNFSVMYPELDPATDYWFKVLPVIGGNKGRTSKENSLTTDDFSVPDVPSNVTFVLEDGRSGFFSVFLTWTNWQPKSPVDYPLLASYVRWGIGKNIDKELVVGVAEVNATTEEYRIDGLKKEDEHGAEMTYWFQVWSVNGRGNGSKSNAIYFSSKQSSDNLVVYIVAPTVTILLVLVVILLLIVYFYWRRKVQKLAHHERLTSLPLNHLYTQTYAHTDDAPDEWEVAIHRVILDTKLGEGSFGEVWKANISGTFGPTDRHASVVRSLGARKRLERRKATEEQSIPVAVKLLKETALEEDRRDLRNEIKLMKRIGAHRHIVSLLGCCTVTELYLIVEFVPHGDLLMLLRKNRAKQEREVREIPKESHSIPKNGYLPPEDGYVPPQDGYVPPEDGYLPSEDAYVPPNLPAVTSGSSQRSMSPVYRFHEDGTPYVTFSSQLLLSYGHQIALGMEYLHSKDMVHRDLACRNVLVDDHQILKISDFGLTRAIYKDEAYVKKTQGRLPVKWMSIEAIFDREFTKQSDVWSFGVVLWEICTMGGFPYPTIPNGKLLGKLRSGYRMEKPSNCSQQLYDVMMDCWDENPLSRPSFSDLAQMFNKMMSGDTHSHLLELNVNLDSDCYLLPVQLDDLLGADAVEKEGDHSGMELPRYEAMHAAPK
ncbi:uncharacterized protein LOC134198105 isoform X2 [Corticium candelabrum]|uniref:uncharacterized protein LOC134198105 isoform X2 n=1 Tax=Corticium candelabrum TaxID=121492 RepID=UPI002E253623|nr:uncharacterized protein LOC134198105 isoform X2 [Corticium candelabrum]